MSNDIKWGLVSDVHFPRHDPRKVELFMKAMKWWQPDAIDLLGDIDDADSTSRWVEGTPRAMELVDDGVKGTREFMAELNEICPKAEDLHFHDGNHGWYRHKKFLDKNAPQFLSLINAETLYQPKNYGFAFHDYDDKPIRRFGNMFAHHGESISKHSGESVRNDVQKELVSLVRGHCFSEDTEILTPTGWKNYKDILVGSQVMTLNRETSQLEWNSVKEKFVYSDYKELISVQSHGLDLMVTPGHGLWVAPRDGKYRVETAEESFGKTRQFILAGEHDEPGLDLSDSQIRLIAWIMTDGTISRKTFRIAQSEVDDRIKKLESVISDCGVEYSKNKRYSAGQVEHGIYHNYDAYRFNLKTSDVEWVWKYLDENKNPTDALRGMSFNQIKIFIESYIDGDGGKNSDAINSYQLNTANETHLNFLQELAVRSGHRSSISRSENRDHWTLTINTKNTVMASKWNKVSYDGNVWCVNVDNSTLVVRRNGKTAITMNSHRQGAYYSTHELAGLNLEGYEIGHLCDESKMTYEPTKNWQAGFAIAHVVNDVPFVQLIQVKMTDEGFTCYVDGRKFVT